MSNVVRYRLADGNVHSISRDELTDIANIRLPFRSAGMGERDELYSMPDGMYLLLHVRKWQDVIQAVMNGASVDSATSDSEILSPAKAAGWLCERGFDDKATAIRRELEREAISASITNHRSATRRQKRRGRRPKYNAQADRKLVARVERVKESRSITWGQACRELGEDPEEVKKAKERVRSRTRNQKRGKTSPE